MLFLFYPEFSVSVGAHCSHACLPHFYEDGRRCVDQTGILGPGRTFPLWHGEHRHGRGHQGERSSLQDGEPAESRLIYMPVSTT